MGKQADTVMLYFPLEYNLRHNISERVARADLEFYAAHTEPRCDLHSERPLRGSSSLFHGKFLVWTAAQAKLVRLTRRAMRQPRHDARHPVHYRAGPRGALPRPEVARAGRWVSARAVADWRKTVESDQRKRMVAMADTDAPLRQTPSLPTPTRSSASRRTTSSLRTRGTAATCST